MQVKKRNIFYKPLADHGIQNDILIDITMTAVRRPEILKRTLHSFFVNCFDKVIDQCRLIINVDPVGDKIPSYVLSDVAGGYFRHYIIGMPMEPSFPRAFEWTWRQTTAPWVFHLEDDWELLEPVDIMGMIDTMKKHKDLASLRLPFFSAGPVSMRNWNLMFPWNGEFFECPQDLRRTAGFCGHPALLRGAFVNLCTPLLDVTLNPEKQFHSGNPELLLEVDRWRYGVYGRPNCNRMLSDIGAAWKVDNKFQKAGSKAFFTHWEETK